MGQQGQQGERKAELARLSPTPENRPLRRIRIATAADNADILSDMRTIVRSQLRHLKTIGHDGPLNGQQGALLHKLAQTYAILDSATDKEHRKYDFTGADDSDLERLAAAARELVSGPE